MPQGPYRPRTNRRALDPMNINNPGLGVIWKVETDAASPHSNVTLYFTSAVTVGLLDPVALEFAGAGPIGDIVQTSDRTATATINGVVGAEAICSLDLTQTAAFGPNVQGEYSRIAAIEV